MGIISVTTIARWPKAWRVDQHVDECVYVREGRPRDPLNHNIANLATGPDLLLGGQSLRVLTRSWPGVGSLEARLRIENNHIGSRGHFFIISESLR